MTSKFGRCRSKSAGRNRQTQQNSKQSQNFQSESHMSSEFHSKFNRPYRCTRRTDYLEQQSNTEFEPYDNNKVDTQTDVNSTRCFRLESVMVVNDIEVNDVSILPLTMTSWQ